MKIVGFRPSELGIELLKTIYDESQLRLGANRNMRQAGKPDLHKKIVGLRPLKFTFETRGATYEVDCLIGVLLEHASGWKA